MLTVTTKYPALSDDEREALDEQNAQTREAVAGKTVAELRKQAADLNIHTTTEWNKARLVDAICRKLAVAAENAARTAVEDADAQTRGFDNAYDERFFARRIEKLREMADRDVLGEFLAKVGEDDDNARRNALLLYQFDWGDGYAEAAASADFARHILAFTEASIAGSDTRKPMTPPDAYEYAVNVVIREPLLSDRWRGSSSSAFRNATEAARRAAASDMLHLW